jgi:hypothetical protein
VTATFTVGSTAVTFGALIDGFNDAGEAPFRTFSVRMLVRGGLPDWEVLTSLRSRVSTRAAPGAGTGSAVYDVGNGAGLGALIIEHLGSGTAYMTGAEVERDLPNHWRIGRGAFQVVSWTPTP